MNEKLISIYDIASTMRKLITNNDETDINIIQLVKELGGRIVYKKIEERHTHGLIVKLNNPNYNFEFIINTKEKNKNDLFYIAHLIGHLVLHLGYIINLELWKDISIYIDSIYSRNGYSSEESDANHFATALMLQNKKFIEYINKHKLNNEIDLKEMSDDLKVPMIFLNLYGIYLGHFFYVNETLH